MAAPKALTRDIRRGDISGKAAAVPQQKQGFSASFRPTFAQEASPSWPQQTGAPLPHPAGPPPVARWAILGGSGRFSCRRPALSEDL